MEEEPPYTFAICAVCGWQDDRSLTTDRKYIGGANPVSLDEARANFASYGAIDPLCKARVHAPLPEETPEG